MLLCYLDKTEALIHNAEAKSDEVKDFVTAYFYWLFC